MPIAKFLGWVNVIREVGLEISWTSNGPLKFAATTTSVDSGAGNVTPIYHPLNVDQQEIRLLTIKPGQFADPLICCLEYAFLSNRTSYTALSYCWGNHGNEKTMTLEIPSRENVYTEKSQPFRGQPRSFEVQIQENLYSALKHLRHENGLLRTVWADALCINQKDIEEKNQQIAIMRSIYSRAEHVFIWLGEGDKETLQMLKNLSIFTGAFERDPAGFLGKASSKAVAPHGKTDVGSVMYGSLSRLFNFDWFTRVWVIQEAFNARIATVQIGNVSLPWPVVIRVGNCMEKARAKAPLTGISTIPDIFLSLIDVKVKPDKIYLSKRLTEDPMAILISSLDLDATNPRDKIFALMQFWQGIDLESLPVEVRPDYNKTTRQVFADLTRWWIQTHQSLRILHVIHTASERAWQRVAIDSSPELPTDRPSWSVWHSGNSAWTRGTLAYNIDCSYRASGSIVTEHKLLQEPSDENVLSLKGFRIGSIREIRRFPWAKAKELGVDDLTEVFEGIFDPAGILGTWTPSGSTALVASPDKAIQTKDHLITHQEFADENDGAVPCISPCLLAGDGQEGEDLVGLCPYAARLGDIIVVLIGGKVPYLIRKQPVADANLGKEHQYGFLGECFVRQYMAGQAITKWRDGNLRMEQFELV